MDTFKCWWMLSRIHLATSIVDLRSGPSFCNQARFTGGGRRLQLHLSYWCIVALCRFTVGCSGTLSSYSVAAFQQQSRSTVWIRQDCGRGPVIRGIPFGTCSSHHSTFHNMPLTRSASMLATVPENGHALETKPRRTRRQATKSQTSTPTSIPSEPLPPQEIPETKPKRKSSRSSATITPSKRSRKTTTSSSSSSAIAVPVTPDNSQSSTTGLEQEPTTPSTIPIEMTSTSTSVPSIVSPSPNKKATAKSPRKRQKTEDKDSSKQQRQYHPPKEDWESIYRLVEELRADRTAPVDTDGSEALPQKHLGPQVYRFQVLIALMLSSQTKDAVVGDAMRQLQQHGLTVANIRNNTSFDQLNQLIGKVGFHNTKAKNILAVAEILDTHYGGDIPPTAQEMIDQLPGVGPKMAYIVENVAWGKQSGIGVDTHMHRMFNQLHWVNSKQPEQTRLQLESWLPREYWPTVNLLWVGLGQEVQQYQDKLLRKALDCSQPQQALKLLKRLGMDYNKVASKMGWTQELATHVGKGGH